MLKNILAGLEGKFSGSSHSLFIINLPWSPTLSLSQGMGIQLLNGHFHSASDLSSYPFETQPLILLGSPLVIMVLTVSLSPCLFIAVLSYLIFHFLFHSHLPLFLLYLANSW